ncbi:hypothetical protein [Neomoorella mulderi]|nr:hypothetical protein [Moorella mulderi]
MQWATALSIQRFLVNFDPSSISYLLAKGNLAVFLMLEKIFLGRGKKLS